MRKEGEKNKSADMIKSFNLFLIQYFHIVTVIIIISFVVLSFFFFLKPKYERIQRRNEISNENKQKEKAALESYDLRLDGYINSYNKISSREKERISKILPSAKNKEDLFVQIEDVVKRRGLLLVSLEINVEDVEKESDSNTRKSAAKKEAPKTPEGVGLININMDVVGLDYQDFKEFIGVFEKNLRIIDINNLSYENEGKSLSISASTYFNYFDKLAEKK